VARNDVKTFVTVCLFGVGATCTAAADELLPNWDINRAALDDANSTTAIATDDIEWCSSPSNATTRACEAGKNILEDGPEAVYNQYVVWQTTARTYLAAHWSQYTEYTKLSCIKETIEIAVRQANHDSRDGSSRPAIGPPNPSYITLLMLMPGGDVEFERMMSKSRY